MPDADDEDDEEPTCPNCGGPLNWKICHALNCEAGYVFYEHDIEPCSTCDGYGGFYSCHHCDLAFYANDV